MFAPWVEYHTADATPYFYNTDTKQTVWELPVSEGSMSVHSWSYARVMGVQAVTSIGPAMEVAVENREVGSNSVDDPWTVSQQEQVLPTSTAI